MRLIRVFASGAEEHRLDEAYTVGNVPKAFGGQPWHVEERDDVPGPPPPPPVTAPTIAESAAVWAEHLERRRTPAVAPLSWHRKRTPPPPEPEGELVATSPGPPVGAAESFWDSYLGREPGAASTKPPWRRSYG